MVTEKDKRYLSTLNLIDIMYIDDEEYLNKLDLFTTEDVEKYDKVYEYFINPNEVESKYDLGHLLNRIEFRTINTVNDVEYLCYFGIVFGFDNAGDPDIEVTLTWYDSTYGREEETFGFELNEFRKFLDYNNKLKISKIWRYVRRREDDSVVGYFN